MAKTLGYIAALFILAPITAMFSEPFFEAIFDILDWDTENWAAPVVQFLRDIKVFLAKPDVLTISYILGAIGLGVWLHRVAMKLDNTRPSKSARLTSLSPMISNVRNEIFDGAKDGFGNTDFNSRNHQTVLRIRVLYAKLKPLGLRPPNYDSYTNMEFNLGHMGYLQTLEPFADHGLLSEAKKETKKAKAEFEAARQDIRSA